MTSLHVICGLGPPNQKSWLRLCWERKVVESLNLMKLVFRFVNVLRENGAKNFRPEYPFKFKLEIVGLRSSAANQKLTSLTEVESRTQGSRPRTQKKSKAKDSLSEDRHSRGHGQQCWRPRTPAQVLSEKKKRGLQKNFSGDL